MSIYGLFQFRARFSAKTDKLIHGVLPAADKILETRWSELNPDLLRLVARKLGDISNVVRFRVVCKQWRSAVSPSDLPSQLPWFLELRGRMCSDIKFYSLYSNKTYTVHVPEADWMLVEGPSESYLLIKDDKHSTPILVNPISRHQLRPPYLKPDGTDCSRELIKRTACCGRKATFYKGNLYHYCYKTNYTKVVDINLNISTIKGKFDVCHLVNAYDDLLAVVRENENWLTDEWRYKVYRLEQDGKTPFWAEMSQGIGDRVLFIDNNGGFCLKSSDFDGLEGNKIYCHRVILFEYHFLVIYDLEKETKQVICPTKMYGTWFVPSL